MLVVSTAFLFFFFHMSYKYKNLDLSPPSPKPLLKSHAKLILLEAQFTSSTFAPLGKEWAIIHILVSPYKPFLRNKYLNLSNNRVWYFQPEAFNRETCLEKLKHKQSTFQSLFCGMNKASFKKAGGPQTFTALSDFIPAWKMPPSCPSSQALNTAVPKRPYYLRAKFLQPCLQE